MLIRLRCQVAQLVILTALLWVIACAGGPHDSRRAALPCAGIRAPVEREQSDTLPFRLVACTVSDSVTSSDELRIVVLVINRTPSAVFTDLALEPGNNLYFDVIGPDGNPYAEADVPFPHEPMDPPRGVFVGRGIMGRTVRLACELPGDIIVPDLRDVPCDPMFELSAPGTYQVVMKVVLQWCPERCGLEDARTALLESAPIPIVRR